MNKIDEERIKRIWGVYAPNYMRWQQAVEARSENPNKEIISKRLEEW